MSWSSNPPKADPTEMAREVAQLWSAMAAEAAHIAHAKRTLYLAYLTEGFTEAQALELSRSL